MNWRFVLRLYKNNASNSRVLLSTHADRQGVDISFVCMVTNFSAEDKASGVKFRTVLLCFKKSGQKSPIWGNFAPPEAPQKPKIGRIGCVARAGQPWRRRRGRAHKPRVGSACVDIQPSPKTYILF